MSKISKVMFEKKMSIERDDMVLIVRDVVKISETDKIITVLAKRPRWDFTEWNDFILQGVRDQSIYSLVGCPFGGYNTKFNRFEVMPTIDEFLLKGVLLLELTKGEMK